MEPIYKRIILKITGEAFSRNDRVLNMFARRDLANEIEAAYRLGIEIGIVVGGGNIARKIELPDVEEETADYMGMMATMINALFLQDILKKRGIVVRTQTAIEMEKIAEPFIPQQAIRHLEKKRIVILAAGIGKPRHTTDYTAIFRADKLRTEAILKGTKVDGIYTGDPLKEKRVKFIPEISYAEMRERKLNVIENTALDLVLNEKVKKIPLYVFDIFKKGNLVRLLSGEKIGSKIY